MLVIPTSHLGTLQEEKTNFCISASWLLKAAAAVPEIPRSRVQSPPPQWRFKIVLSSNRKWVRWYVGELGTVHWQFVKIFHLNWIEKKISGILT